MKVVSNTGPLSTLGKLGQLDLLDKLYGEILIPPKVQDEIAVGVRLNYPHCHALAEKVTQGRLRVVEINAPFPSFQLPIDLGEVAAIGLALQEKADLILIDERDGRDEAERLGLKVPLEFCSMPSSVVFSRRKKLNDC